jgi:ADP-dependent NAD(P)H-hydrate dehydratase / NAD(P)H-hydrate epimerase
MIVNGLDLYRPEQLRELDRLAAASPQIGNSLTLMERAGAAAYALLRRRWPTAQRIRIVAGIGNNAGDGYVLARLAAEGGLQVDLQQIGDAGRLRGDALTARQRFGAAMPSAGELPAADVVVDALFGIGLDRPLEGEWRAAVEAINAAGAPVLALDVPSGLCGASGAVLGSAVRADVTATFIGLKTGLFTGSAAAVRGEIVCDDLDVPADVFARIEPAARLIAPEAAASWLVPRPADAHKGQHGHVLVVGGEQGMPGAVRMAGEAALRIGAGLVSVATREEHAAAVLAGRPELMCRPIEQAEQLDPLLARAGVIVVGPGLGQAPWGRALLARVLESELPLVVDADGLNLLAAAPCVRDNWILTPHPGEAARMLGCSGAEVQVDRYAAAAEIGRRYGGVCVLKGAGTIIQAPQQPAQVCAAGNPGMASGGMGDVLSGVIAGLIAQGLPLGPAAWVGVQLHAAAGDRAAVAGQRGLLASDLMPHLRKLVNPK